MFYLIANAAEESGNNNGNGSIVSCNGMDCDICKLLETISNLFNWLTWTSFAVAVLFIVVGGFIYIGSKGNENWMFQAKRTVIWAISGFAFILVAWLAIQITFRIVGVSDQSLWQKFECLSDAALESDMINNIPQRKTVDLIKSSGGGGELSGRLDKSTSINDLVEMFNNLSAKDILVLETIFRGRTKALAALGKVNNAPELLYVDKGAIMKALQAKTDFNNILLPTAQAQKQTDPQADKIFYYLAQIITRLLEKNQEVVVIVTDRPIIGLNGNSMDQISISAIMKTASNIDQCINSAGTWYRFKDICSAEQEKCQAIKCALPDNLRAVSACNCPEGKCLENGNCKQKQ